MRTLTVALIAATLAACGGGGGGAAATTTTVPQTGPQDDVVVRYDHNGDGLPDVLTLDRGRTPFWIVSMLEGTGDDPADRTDLFRGLPIDPRVSDAIADHLAGALHTNRETEIDVVHDSGQIIPVALLHSPSTFGEAEDGATPGCGAAGDPVLLRGEGFGEDPAVAFGGVDAKVSGGKEDRILVLVPEGVDPGGVSVTVDGALVEGAFTVLEEGAPVVLHLSATTATPDQPLFLIGRRLRGGEAAFVDGGGVPQATVELKGGAHAAYLRVPETLAAGSYTLVVTNADGLDNGACAPGIEIVAAGDATLTAIEPAAAHPAHRIVLTGTDLAPPGPCRVVWTDAGGEELKAFGWSNGYDRVLSRVPFRAEAGADYDVGIELRHDNATGTLAYTVGTPEAPVIQELDPAEGPAGTVFRIKGKNLLVLGSKPEVSMTEGVEVLFAMPGFSRHLDVIVVRVPGSAADGDYDVTVTVAGETSNAATFKVGDLPLTVSSTKPDSQGARGTYRPVLVKGTGFGPRGSGPIAVVWDDGTDVFEGKIIFRTDKRLLVIPPGGRFDPLPLGSYTVKVVRGDESADAGTYNVE